MQGVMVLQQQHVRLGTQSAFVLSQLIGEVMFEFLVGTAAAIYIWKYFGGK